MSGFVNSLSDRLTAMGQQIESLLGELDSIAAHLDKGKLISLLYGLNQDCNRLFHEHSAAQSRGVWAPGLIIQSQRPYIRPVTREDLSRWQEQYKSKIRVVIGAGKVQVTSVSDLANEYETTVSQTILVAQQQGYIVLSWDQYLKLLDEMGKLIGEDK